MNSAALSPEGAGGRLAWVLWLIAGVLWGWVLIQLAVVIGGIILNGVSLIWQPVTTTGHLVLTVVDAILTTVVLTTLLYAGLRAAASRLTTTMPREVSLAMALPALAFVLFYVREALDGWYAPLVPPAVTLASLLVAWWLVHRAGMRTSGDGRWSVEQAHRADAQEVEST